jgi:hypothetical protein
VDHFSSKTFFAHVDDASFLPTWNGMQLDNFMLALEELVPGGYADGTDHLPVADPAITIAEFGGFNQIRLIVGETGQLIGTPSSFALTSVPEVSPGGLCAAGGLAVLLFKRRRRLVEGSARSA